MQSIQTTESEILALNLCCPVRGGGGQSLTLRKAYPSSQTTPVAPQGVCPFPRRQTVFRNQKDLVHTSLGVLERDVSVL